MSIFDKTSNASYWRGFDYFKSNRVKDLKEIRDGVYSAKVRGTKTYDVVVDLNHPLSSSCNCPFTEGNHRMCKHMLAVAFSVCPNEAKEAQKIEDHYNYVQEHKEERLSKIMEEKRKEVRQYVDSLSNDELKTQLYTRLINDKYEDAYKMVYEDESYDCDDWEDDELFDEDEYDDDPEELRNYDEDFEPNKTNGITDWKLGDKAFHENFGEGVVTNFIDTNIIEVDFKRGGKKSILSTHYKLTRK